MVFVNNVVKNSLIFNYYQDVPIYHCLGVIKYLETLVLINFLLDLAGSEMTKKTQSEGKTLEEANNINKR